MIRDEARLERRGREQVHTWTTGGHSWWPILLFPCFSYIYRRNKKGGLVVMMRRGEMKSKTLRSKKIGQVWPRYAGSPYLLRSSPSLLPHFWHDAPLSSIHKVLHQITLHLRYWYTFLLCFAACITRKEMFSPTSISLIKEDEASEWKKERTRMQVKRKQRKDKKK